MTLLGARAYCNWVGGRLPTAEEWEFVAGNGRGDEYPWGNEAPAPELANYGEHVGGTTPVGSFPPNRFGVYDLAGNVWEWTADGHDAPGQPGRDHLFPERQYLIKGGGWSYGAESLRIRTISSSWGLTGGNCLGFRPVFDASAWRFESGLIAGRFSPLHLGHVRIVERALEECRRVYAVIGSCNPALDERTFLLGAEREVLLRSLFGRRLAGVYAVPDVPDDDRWVDSVLTRLPERPVAVYGGDWRDIALFEATGLFVCRVNARRTRGISGTAIREKLRREEPVDEHLPEGQAEKITDAYRIRRPLFDPVPVTDLSEDWFARLIEALRSVEGSLYRQAWRFSDPRCGGRAVELISNDLATISACDRVLCFCCQQSSASASGGVTVYAYRTGEIPRVGEREGWQHLRLHDRYPGYRLPGDQAIDLLSPWDERRLYVWNRTRRTLVAFLREGDDDLVLDPMRIIREALLETLPPHWVKAHAACLTVGTSGGVLFTGPKRSGKSTVLMHLLTCGRHFRFVADDKVMIDPGRRLALGVPQAVRFGLDAALANPVLRERTLDLARASNPRYFLDRRSGEEKIQIFPKDLLGLLKVDVKPLATVHLGVVLDLSPETRPFEVEEAPAAALVNESMYRFSDEIRPDWMELREGRGAVASLDVPWVVCRGSLLDPSHLEAIADLVEKRCSEIDGSSGAELEPK